MAEFQALRGARYDQTVAGDLGTLIAPPYDAASPEHFAFLRALNPFNIVHLEQAEADAGNGIDHHAVAAARYRDWRRQGILRQDRDPACYLYRQTVTLDGQRRTQHGLIATVRLVPWDERLILPHEETFPGPRQERLARLRAVRANLSPIELLYHDPTSELEPMLAELARQPVTAAATDPAGDRHELTRITDTGILDRLVSFFGDRRLYVADGHHRYEAALTYRDECRRTLGPAVTLETDFILATLIEINDPGITVLPTHRLLHGGSGLDTGRLLTRLRELFAVDHRPTYDPAALLAQPRTICVLRLRGEADLWQISALPGAPHERLLSAEHSAVWRQLPVSILRGAIFEHALGLSEHELMTHISFAHDLATVEAALVSGAAAAAFLVPATTLPQLLAVADAGDRMPPKSTYFQPKIPAGLVLHDLRSSGPRTGPPCRHRRPPR